MITIQGKGISAGIGIGPVCFLRQENEAIGYHTVTDWETEWARFQSAQAEAIAQLGELSAKAMSAAGREAAELFVTHQMMAEDLDFEEAIKELIHSSGLNAEAAVTEVGQRFAEMFAAMDDDYMQARRADVEDVTNRIVRILSGSSTIQKDITVPVILAAEALAPSETLQHDKDLVLAFITRNGASSSHTAILARSMGIPAVTGIQEQLRPEYEGRITVVDGSSGIVIIEPDEYTLQRYEAKAREWAETRRMLEILKGLPNVTKDGQNIRICCNIDSPKDIHAVKTNDGGGIGLFRSEFLFMKGQECPSEDDQFEAYKKVLTEMTGKRVIIRTLDIGADKCCEHFRLPSEGDPSMGLRGLRFCLERPDIFCTQLRALYRSSVYGELGIMFPFVTSVWEVREAKRLCEKVKDELRTEGIPFDEQVKIGITIETPAAALMSDRLAHEADFFSCGTNDLSQYTLACDRQSSDLGRFYNPYHPAVLRLLKLVVDNAHQNGLWVSICGELAADLEMTAAFLAMGVDELSVTPRAVLPLRHAIREKDMRKLRNKVLEEIESGHTPI